MNLEAENQRLREQVDTLETLAKYANKERMDAVLPMVRQMNNGDWQQVAIEDPQLAGFIIKSIKAGLK